MPRRYVKYTREILEPVVAESTSIRQVLLHFGVRETGGGFVNMQKRIREYGLDTSHFVGQGHMKGKRALNRMTAEELLVLGQPSDPKLSADVLRRCLDEIGRPRVCVDCGNGEIWNNKPLRLQVDHINGFRWDNRATNLRYLCPNCHTQTETFGSANKANKWESTPTAEGSVREAVQ